MFALTDKELACMEQCAQAIVEGNSASGLDLRPLTSVVQHAPGDLIRMLEQYVIDKSGKQFTVRAAVGELFPPTRNDLRLYLARRHFHAPRGVVRQRYADTVLYELSPLISGLQRVSFGDHASVEMQQQRQQRVTDMLARVRHYVVAYYLDSTGLSPDSREEIRGLVRTSVNEFTILDAAEISLIINADLDQLIGWARSFSRT